MRFTPPPPKTVFMKRHCFPASLVSVSAMLVSMCQKISLKFLFKSHCHQCYNVTMLHVTCYIKKNQLWAFSGSKNSIYK